MPVTAWLQLRRDIEDYPQHLDTCSWWESQRARIEARTTAINTQEVNAA